VVQDPVVALTDRDLLLHVAPAAEVVTHVVAEADVPLGDWTFFDGVGLPLTAETDDSGVLVGFVETSPGVVPSASDKQLLVDRLHSFLARAQVRLDAENAAAGGTPAHVRVPRVDGDLPDVITALNAVMRLPTSQPDVRDWLHNLGHRLGLI
jgi:hypothetical protein